MARCAGSCYVGCAVLAVHPLAAAGSCWVWCCAGAANRARWWPNCASAAIGTPLGQAQLESLEIPRGLHLTQLSSPALLLYNESTEGFCTRLVHADGRCTRAPRLLCCCTLCCAGVRAMYTCCCCCASYRLLAAAPQLLLLYLSSKYAASSGGNLGVARNDSSGCWLFDLTVPAGTSCSDW